MTMENDHKSKKKEARIGDLVKVTWMDATGSVNEPFKDVGLEVSFSWGVLAKQTEQVICLCTSIYPDDKDKTGDYSNIPAPWVKKIELIRRRAYKFKNGNFIKKSTG